MGLAKYLALVVLSAGAETPECEPQRPSLFPRPELNKPLYIPSPFGIPSSRDYYMPKIENVPFMQKPKETMIVKNGNF